MKDFRGPIALILALGVALALVSGVLAAELTPGKVTSEEISFLSTLGGAAIGAIASYLGTTHRHPHPTDWSHMTDPQPTEPTEAPGPDPEPIPDPEPKPEEPETPLIGDDEGEGEDVGPDTDG